MSLHPFIHLRLHTEYSLLDGAVRVDSLMDAAAAAGMPAVAVTDECNLFAMVKFYRAALARGIKPLIGVDLWLKEAGEREPPSRLTLLCQNDVGYLNLSRLVSRAFLEGERSSTPLINREWLGADKLVGLIALSGGWEGDIARSLSNGRVPQAKRQLKAWVELFGDRFYIELQRLGRAGDEAYVAAALTLAGECGVAVVATNDVRFVAKEDFEAHEARVCIHDGTQLADPSRRRKYSREQYLRTAEEMAQVFADVPEALQNTVEIARRCSLPLKLGETRLPVYPVPPQTSAEAHVRELAIAGLATRLQARVAAVAGITLADYEARLARELDVICSMGFASYFLIVADFIRWARENGVPVGPGRGSGAGSLVAWVLRITDLDPLEHDLLFERFLNPERVSMPDFDIDFCMEGRDRVIDYVSNKYGRDRVSQIITYGTMAAKAVVRDVGRVLGHPYGFVDRIAKLIPFELGITLKDALEKEPELARLYRDDEDVRILIDLAQSLEGLTRNAGTNASGVVIAPSVLTDFTPLFCEAGSQNVVTQFDKDDVEATGLVKFDFLGLRTLTIIDRAVRIINSLPERADAPLDMTALPMDDAATFTLLKTGFTTAVFQLESRGMKDLIRRLKPDRFEDVVALVALFRPGPLQSGMVDDFIARKHAPGTAVDYLHPMLKPVLETTYGVILYQEQVMKIAQVMSGYTLGGADLLRRAMGKKKPEEMAQQRSGFVEGAVARGVDGKQAAWIFDLIEKFAGYGFNKSHSAAYALLSYQTGWLKAHYPAAFMAAVLSSDIDHTDKVVTLVDECARMGLSILPPDLNASQYDFTVADQRTIRYGLGAIRGVGAQAVEELIQERTLSGPFTSLVELCRRINLTRINKRVLEALIRSGSLDSMSTNRATLLAGLEAAVQGGEQLTRSVAAGQVDLFGGATAVVQPQLPEWNESLRLAGERETLGLYLTGHPITRFESELRRLVTGRLVDLISERPPAAGEGGRHFGGRTVSAAGLILEIRKRNNRTSFVLDDRTGRIEVTVFEEQMQQFRDLVVKDALVLVEGSLRFDEFSDGWRIACKRIVLLDALREQQARRLVLRWPDAPEVNSERLLGRLKAALNTSRPGPCEVLVRYRGSGARCTLALGPDWSIRPTPALMEELESLLGRDSLHLLYDLPASGSLRTAAQGT
jgi:DNA polymerase-3 subunit alpha